MSTNPKVWKVLSVIFLLLTGLVALSLYFETLFATVVIGIALMLVTEKRS